MEIYEHPSRVNYLNAIEQAISRNENNGFKYVLIRQIYEDEVIAYSDALNAHCHQVLEAKHNLVQNQVV